MELWTAERRSGSSRSRGTYPLPRGIVRSARARLTYKQTASVVINRNHRRQTHVARVSPVGRHWPSAGCTRKERAHVIPDQYLWPRSKGGCWIAGRTLSRWDRTAVNIYNMIVVVAAALEKTRFAVTSSLLAAGFCLTSARAGLLFVDWFAWIRAACVTPRCSTDGPTLVYLEKWKNDDQRRRKI